MVITKEDARRIKKHLLGQLDNFPEEKRSEIEKQIKSMTLEEVESFIKKNELNHLSHECLFCSIATNKTKSYKVGENFENVAILELNPMSKGHILIIPKEHSKELPKSSNDLAQEVGRKIKENLKPKEIKLNKTSIMDHPILEIIPHYGEKLEKTSLSEDELLELQEQIKKPKEIKIKEKGPEIKIERIPILPRRVP